MSGRPFTRKRTKTLRGIMSRKYIKVGVENNIKSFCFETKIWFAFNNYITKTYDNFLKYFDIELKFSIVSWLENKKSIAFSFLSQFTKYKLPSCLLSWPLHSPICYILIYPACQCLFLMAGVRKKGKHISNFYINLLLVT